MKSSVTTAALSLYPLVRQTSAGGVANATALWLVLGAVLGIAYTLATEKYLRAMQHRHLFVRLSMLFLSAFAWLGAAIAVSFVCVQIYNQSEGIEGVERVLGVLIPAVVRADLVVDWARRVSWALLNFRAWVDAVVQTHRIVARSDSLRALRVSRDVRALAAAARTLDPVAAEALMWSEDVGGGLVRVPEIINHFRKLARVSAYGTAAFFAAVPAAVMWIAYAAYSAIGAVRSRNCLSATLYIISVPFAPLAAVIVLIASAILVIGVVSLTVAGTLIQFSVYWSVRVVYAMARTALSEEWAGFPIISKKRAAAAATDANGLSRRPVEAAVAMAHLGGFFPTELEFVLSAWDGSTDYEDAKVCDRVDLRIAMRDGAVDGAGVRENAGSMEGALPADIASVHVELPLKYTPMESETTASTRSEPLSAKDANGMRHLWFLARLGLDGAVNSKRKRRLATYYALAILVNMQVESGGKAWCMDKVPEMSDDEFDARIDMLDSFVADEARDAVAELSDRLKRMLKYRIVHSGSEVEELVTVQQWLRSVLLFLLETKIDTPGAVGMLVRRHNVRITALGQEDSGAGAGPQDLV